MFQHGLRGLVICFASKPSFVSSIPYGGDRQRIAVGGQRLGSAWIWISARALRLVQGASVSEHQVVDDPFWIPQLALGLLQRVASIGARHERQGRYGHGEGCRGHPSRGP